MLINTQLTPETATQDLRNSRAATPPPVSSAATSSATAPTADPALQRLLSLAPLDEVGTEPISDSTVASQVTQFLRANLDYASALAAQANLSPDSAFNLLR